VHLCLGVSVRGPGIAALCVVYACRVVYETIQTDRQKTVLYVLPRTTSQIPSSFLSCLRGLHQPRALSWQAPATRPAGPAQSRAVAPSRQQASRTPGEADTWQRKLERVQKASTTAEHRRSSVGVASGEQPPCSGTPRGVLAALALVGSAW